MQGNIKRKMDQNNIRLIYMYEPNNITLERYHKKKNNHQNKLETKNWLVHVILFCSHGEKEIKVHIYRNKLQVD